MGMHILNPDFANRTFKEHRASGNDRWDEVWDGVYILMPNPNIEHQEIATRFAMALGPVIEWPGLGSVFQGVNVSDRADDWTKNYRCPDVAVYLAGNPASARESHWLGGPDFAIEIISPYDRSREKLDFYASVGVRELLLIDRDPWTLELFHLHDGKMTLTGTSSLEEPPPISVPRSCP